MNTQLKPLSFNEASEETQNIFTAIKEKVGKLPNLYAAMGVSSKLLSGYLNFTETLKSGEFSDKEYEAIALVTSQVNDCEYCISAHTTLAKMQGFDESEIIQLRQNSITDTKLNALVSLTNEIVRNNGCGSNITTENFLNHGYNKAAFAELIAIVAMITITNNIYHNGGFEIDFPIAPQLNNKQVA